MWEMITTVAMAGSGATLRAAVLLLVVATCVHIARRRPPSA